MGKVRKLSPSERRDIVRMFPQLGVTETARRIGCSKSTVQRVWASNALRRTMPREAARKPLAGPSRRRGPRGSSSCAGFSARP